MNLLFIDHHQDYQTQLLPGFFKELGNHCKVLIVHQNRFLHHRIKEKPIEIHQNVWSVQRLPFAPYRMILLSDTLSKLDAKGLYVQCKKYLSYLNFQPTFTEFISPFFRNHFQPLFSKFCSYWIIDHYSQVPGQPIYMSAIQAKYEKICAQKADIVFTTSRTLKNIFQTYTKRIVFIPNSADDEFFCPKWMSSTEEPEILKKYSRPIFGYFGGINSILDWDALLYLSQIRPYYTFLLFGWIDGGPELQQNNSFKKVMLQKNVHFVGKIPYNDLPTVMSHIDVGMILDAPNDFSKTRNQNKVYQYLLSGIPIIGPFAQPDYTPFKSLLHLAETKEELPEKADLALQANTPEQSKRRRMYAEKISLKSIVRHRIQCYENLLNNLSIEDFSYPPVDF
ncbi:MAG: hypothetical protein N2450_03120 [bacterium]|nr:hypothetical protein [bacterium]